MFSQNQILKAGHFGLVALLAIVSLGLLATNVHAQVFPEPQFSDILQTRESCGGSIFPEWEGQVPGLEKAESSSEFRKEVERLVQQQNEQNEQNEQEEQEEQEELNQLRAEVANTRRSVWGEASQRSQPFVVDSWEKVKAFREVARELERAAWQLEEVGAYDAGDSLRAQANELRQNARTFKD